MASTTARERAREDLLARIRAGAYADGRLPPERELAEQLGVSRTTVRGVLHTLADDGIVSRRRRHGTIVNEQLLRSGMRLNRLEPFVAMIERAGFDAVTEIGPVSVTALDAESATALRLPEGTPAACCRRVHRAGSAPAIAVTDLVAFDRLRVAPEAVEPAETTFEFVARNTALVPDYASTAIAPRVAFGGEPAGLDLVPGTPYVELAETMLTAAHDPVAFSRVAVDDRIVRLSLVRRGH